MRSCLFEQAMRVERMIRYGSTNILPSMPTYEYHCDACSHEFEEFQYIKDEPLKTCPVCGKKKLRRLIGCGAAIVFKGGGFYQTDYRSESYKSSAKADSTASSSTAAVPKDAPKKAEPQSSK